MCLLILFTMHLVEGDVSVHGRVCFCRIIFSPVLLTDDLDRADDEFLKGKRIKGLISHNKERAQPREYLLFEPLMI